MFREHPFTTNSLRLCSLISHVFCTGPVFPVTAAVFGETVGALAPFGLPIAALGFPMGTTAGGAPASASAIRLPAIAATADAKGNVAKTACHANQKHNPALPRTEDRATIQSLQRAFGLVPKVMSKSPKCPFRAFPFLRKIHRDLAD
jgi:hypothetical protein